MELPNRADLEADFAGTLARLSSRHRRELMDLLGQPPDINRVPASFWAKVEKETRDELLAALLLILLSSSTLHGWSGNQTDAWATQWSADHAGSVAADYAANSRDMLTVAGQAWGEMKPTRGDVLDTATSIFGPDRAARMATTETTVAQTQGGEMAITMTVGLSDEDEWKTNPHLSVEGPCRICAPLNGTTRDVWGLQFPDGPPAHCACVCEIIFAHMPELIGA